MGPKKQKTRHSSGSFFGPSADLPDDGDLFTLRDVLAAAERKFELHPHVTSSWVASQLVPLVKHKWKTVNPEISLHNDEAIKKKIERVVCFCRKN